MSFDYNELRVRQSSGGTQWASYSDLFMVLAFVFLLMYMVSSLRSGMVTLTSMAELDEAKQELEIYESIKDSYLNEQTSVLEQKIYKKVIDQIALLETQASDEKEKHARMALEQAERESSLNQYQQLIVSMMKANTIGKAEAVAKISTQEQENAELQQTVTTQAAEQEMLEQTLEIKTEFLERKISNLTAQQHQSQDELDQLEQQLSLETVERAKLEKDSAELEKVEQKFASLKSNYEKKQNELASLELNIVAGRSQMENLEKDYQGKLKELENKYSGLQNEFQSNQAQVALLKTELGGAKATLQDVTQDLTETESNLAATSKALQNALEIAKYRQKVAGRIKERFEEAGIDADVNTETGEVVLGFGDEYFDTNSHRLKPGMEQAIRDTMPVYAESLFSSQSMTTGISAIEIIGFASPTYGGKPINPTSLSEQNRTAVNYNLNLSYERARSIFEYAFDTNTLEFEHQETMLPLIKVTGRSFFTEQVNPEDTGNLSKDEFCKLYNCTGSQRVIIKFDLKQKENG